METQTLIVLVIAGLGALLLVVGVLLSRAGPSVVEERLGRYSDGAGVSLTQTSAEKRAERSRQVSEFVNQLGEGTDIYERISRHLARADIKFRPAEYIALMVVSAIGTAVVGSILFRSVPLGMGAGIFGIFIPSIYVSRAQKKRLVTFNNQLGDMINLMVNGLRAGYSTLQAMEAVSKELPAPISDEFRRVVQEIQLGISMEEALDHLLRRISSDDLDLVITAINVQREVGGNLAVILDVISYTIRERVRIQGEISALTAQGRMTAWVISLLPVVLLIFLFIANRPYFMQFFNPGTRTCGISMLVIAGLMVLAGFAVVQRIVRIDI
jgi:tight adherence protein B